MAGLAPHAAWHGEGVREVPLEDEDGGEGNESEIAKEGGGVGRGVHKKTKMGGLGRLKDYSKRKAEVPNPWAPPQVGEGGREGGREGRRGCINTLSLTQRLTYNR